MNASPMSGERALPPPLLAEARRATAVPALRGVLSSFARVFAALFVAFLAIFIS
jgi:hypothetical protein